MEIESKTFIIQSIDHHRSYNKMPKLKTNKVNLKQQMPKFQYIHNSYLYFYKYKYYYN